MSSKPSPRGRSNARERGGEPSDAQPVKPQRAAFGVRLPPDLIKDVKREAIERDQTVQEFTETALRAALGR